MGLVPDGLVVLPEEEAWTAKKRARAVLCALFLLLTAGFVFGWPALQDLLIEAGVPADPLFFDLTFGVASALVDFASLVAIVTNKRSFRVTAICGSVCQGVGAGCLAIGVGIAGAAPNVVCLAFVFAGACVQACAGMFFLQCTMYPGISLAVFISCFNSSSAVTAYLRLALETGGTDAFRRNFVIFLGIYAVFGWLLMLPCSFLWDGQARSATEGASSSESASLSSSESTLLLNSGDKNARPRIGVMGDIRALRFRKLVIAVVLLTAVIGLNIKFALGSMAQQVENAVGSKSAIKLATQFYWFAPILIVASGLAAHWLMAALQRLFDQSFRRVLWILLAFISLASATVFILLSILVGTCPTPSSCSDATILGYFYSSNVLNIIVWNTLYVVVLAQIGSIWGGEMLPLVFSLAMVAQVATVASSAGLLYWGNVSFLQPDILLVCLAAVSVIVLIVCVKIS